MLYSKWWDIPYEVWICDLAINMDKMGMNLLFYCIILTQQYYDYYHLLCKDLLVFPNQTFWWLGSWETV